MSERRRAPRARRPAHGTDGLGDLGLRPKLAGASADRAHERLVELARANPGALTLVTLGPLTSIALALREEPDLLRLLKRTVAMAGAVSGPGTATPRAEFNVWADPDAAQQVFAAALPLTMVPIELSRGPAALGPGDQAQIEAIDTPFARFVAQMCRASANRPGQVAKRRAAGLPDAIAMAVAIDPTLVLKSRRFFVEVETAAGLSEGETVVDLTGRLGRTANAEIIEQIDVQRYKTMLLDACR